jgi:hypothetical protein
MLQIILFAALLFVGLKVQNSQMGNELRSMWDVASAWCEMWWNSALPNTKIFWSQTWQEIAAEMHDLETTKTTNSNTVSFKSISVNPVHNALVELPPTRSFPLPTPILCPVNPPLLRIFLRIFQSDSLTCWSPPIPLLYIINFPPRVGPPRPVLAPARSDRLTDPPPFYKAHHTHLL